MLQKHAKKLMRQWWERPMSWLSLAIVMACYTVAMFVYYLLEDPMSRPLPFKDQPFPVQHLTRFPDAQGVPQSEWLGRRGSFLYFFGSWCHVCDVTTAAMKQHNAQEGAIPVLPVAVQDQAAGIRAWLLKHGYGVAWVAWDQDGALAGRLQLRGVPELWLIDPNGTVTGRWAGKDDIIHALKTQHASTVPEKP